MAKIINDRNDLLQMIVLFSNRNNFDISAWIPVPLVLADVFDSFEWPLGLILVSWWVFPSPFMILCVDGVIGTRKDSVIKQEEVGQTGCN
jgi:hypothetical protein